MNDLTCRQEAAHRFGMTLQNQLSAAPLPFEPAVADEVLARFPNVTLQLRSLLRGMAGSSSFLRSLLEIETEWFTTILDLDPDTAFEEILENLQKFIDQGKIRHVGLSNETPWGLSRFLEIS